MKALQERPAGPYRSLVLHPSGTAPLYILPFGRDGRDEATRTRAHLLQTLRSGDFTDVFLFAHGWNSAWKDAVGHYDHFINGFAELRRGGTFPADRPYRPLLVGVYWPSIILESHGARAPRFASAGAQDPMELAELSQALPSTDVERLHQLMRSEDGLDGTEARELAEIVAPLSAGTGDELGEEPEPLKPDVILRTWAALSAPDGTRDGSQNGWGTVEDRPGGPHAAGIFRLDPRDLLRGLTVWQMKDRAGVVGSHGVGPLLRELLGTTGEPRLHLVGHSYGAKVLLSAIASGGLPRPVTSLLLLQPAVNHHCFAAAVPRTSRPGGYRPVLAAVEQPILSTYSAADLPLTRFFHLALRRGGDLGEPMPAPWPSAPSEYAALGGYGPAGLGAQCRRIPLNPPGVPYELAPDGAEVYALDGSKAIAGHSDISNPSTWWALCAQVTG